MTANNYSPEFEKAIISTFGHEGGLANDPNDRGGLTNYGITQGVYSEWTGTDKSVREITRAEAKQIYWMNYWLEGKCDRIPYPIAIIHLDSCVNAGVTQSIRFLQRTLRVKDDGVFGPKTEKAVNEIYIPSALDRYAISRITFYHGLTDDPTQRKFWNSWLTRSIAALGEAYEEYWKSARI